MTGDQSRFVPHWDRFQLTFESKEDKRMKMNERPNKMKMTELFDKLMILVCAFRIEDLMP